MGIWLDRLKMALAGDVNRLRYMARFLGHNFHRKDLNVLGEFRSSVAYAFEKPLDPFIKGYFEALMDITAAYLVPIEEDMREQEDLDFLRDNGFKPLMLALLEGDGEAEILLVRFSNYFFLTPNEKSVTVTRCSCSLEEIKNKLAILCQLGVAESFANPLHYRLTLRGERIASRWKMENK